MEKERLCSSAASTPPLPKKAASASATPNSPIPLELIVEILSRLPVKSIFKFRCVCKSLDALFDDTHFLKKHMHHMHMNMLANPISHLKILTTGVENKSSLQSFPISTLCPGKPQPLPFPLPQKDYVDVVKVIGSCNGMVCLRVLEEGETIYFWNPLTNQYIQLPYTFSLSHHLNIFGFGFDDSINEFKLVRLFCNQFEDYNKFSAEVYGMWEGSRKQISDFPFGHRPCCPGMYGRPFSVGIYLNGALHWVASVSSNSWVIVALDLAKERFRKLLLPEQDGEREWEDLNLYWVGEFLCVMVNHQNQNDLWIMKEYGVRESWAKMIKMGTNLDSQSQLSERTLFLPLYFFENNKDDFLMIFNGKLVLGNSRENSNKKDLEIGRDFQNPSICLTYVDTVFTPNVMMRLRGDFHNKHTRLKMRSRDWGNGVIAWRGVRARARDVIVQTE